MAIEGFDYKEFAQMMSSQAGELVPANFDEMQKNYVVKTLTNFTLLAGEAISNDEKLNFNADQAVFVTQIIAEWSFHKSIDLVHSGIMPEHWDGVMQKIAFTIFEIAKQAIQKNIPQDKTLQLIEHHVDKTYKEAIEDLERRGVISNEISQKAASQSNIDDMAKQVQEQEDAAAAAAAQAQAAQAQAPQRQAQQPIQSSHMGDGDVRVTKMKSIAMVLKLLDQERVQEILDQFAPEVADEIVSYVNTPKLESQVDINFALQCLEDLKIVVPKRQKLSPRTMIKNMDKIFENNDMEKVEQLVKPERPYVKRFISQAYEGEYYDSVPLKVAELLVKYIKDSV